MLGIFLHRTSPKSIEQSMNENPFFLSVPSLVEMDEMLS